MKRILTLLLAAAVALACPLTSLAAQTVRVSAPDEVTMVFSSDYTAVTRDNLDTRGTLISFLGKTADDFKTLFDNGCIAWAVSSDYSRQISVRWTNDTVSNAVGDLTSLDEKSLSSAKKLLTGSITQKEGMSTVITEEIHGGLRYLRVISVPKKEAEGDGADDAQSGAESEDSSTAQTSSGMSSTGGESSRVSSDAGAGFLYYVTVVKSICYVVCFSDESGEVTAQNRDYLSDFADSLVIGNTDGENVNYTVQVVVIWVMTGLLAALCAFCIVRLARASRSRRTEEDFKNKAPHKPRR